MSVKDEPRPHQVAESRKKHRDYFGDAARGDDTGASRHPEDYSTHHTAADYWKAHRDMPVHRPPAPDSEERAYGVVKNRRRG